jgi:hypothetical protein
MNFKEYIENDIEEKKVLLNLLPKNTEARLTKYKDTINEIITKYEDSISSTRKYIDYKYKKLYPQVISKKEKEKVLINKIDFYKKLLVETNPVTSFFEKLEFDTSFFKLMKYYDYTIYENNLEILNLINKLEFAGIKLSSEDFKLNTYTFVYMDYFFSVKKDPNLLNDSKFDQILWKSPKLYENIIICLRLIIKKNLVKLKLFSKKNEIKVLKNAGFNSREALVNEILLSKSNLEQLHEKNEDEIIMDFINDDLDISLYMENDKFDNNLVFFLIENIDTNNTFEFSKTINSIFTLEANLNEYKQYTKYKIVFDDLKKQYEQLSSKTNKKDLKKKFTDLGNSIYKNISKAQKLSIKKQKYDLDNLDLLLNDKEKDTIFEQQKLLDEIYKQFITYNDYYYDLVLLDKINNNSLLDNIVNIIISFPYFSKKKLKTLLELTENEEVDSKSEELFDLFYNPYKKILNMKRVFTNDKFERELMNCYRFENLNIREDSFQDENLELILLNCYKLHIRIKMKSFKHSIDEIKFLVDVKKLYDSEN